MDAPPASGVRRSPAQTASRRCGGRARGRLRRLLLGLVGLLYVASVPWYRDAGAPLVVVLGLPDWVTVALSCYVAVAILNAAAWLLTEVDDGPAAEADAAPPEPGR